MSEQTFSMESFNEAVSGLRKAAYEFGMTDYPDDHQRMMDAQKGIYDELDKLRVELSSAHSAGKITPFNELNAASNIGANSAPREAFGSALDEYWNLAFAEGARNGRYDTENGDAQRVRSQLVGMFTALSSAPSAEPICWNCRCPDADMDLYNGDEREFVTWSESDAMDAKAEGFAVTPYYTAHPHLSAAVAAAREQDAGVCDELANNPENGTEYQNGAEWAGNRIRALQSADGLAALRELIERAVRIGYGEGLHDGFHGTRTIDRTIDSLCDRVLKGE